MNKILIGLAGAALGYTAFKLYKQVTAYSLKDKVVLITGGTHGLGFVLARKCLDEQAKVVICGRNQENLSSALERLGKNNTNVLAIPCDVTKRSEVKKIVELTLEKMGTIDVLINNAGIIQFGPFESMTEEDFDKSMDVHFRGPMVAVMEIVPHMIKKGGGRIVNISSVGGKVPVPHLLPYTASKYALNGFSLGLRSELRQYGIHVTTVNPGLIRTGSARYIGTKGEFEKELAFFSTLGILPLITMSAGYAAGRIITALKYNKAEITLSLPAKLLAGIQFFFPGMVTTIFALVNKYLPRPTGSVEKREGTEISTRYFPSFVVRRYAKLAEKYNQVPGRGAVSNL
ncbi:MAG: SDR family oxidoreductase [Bacteroidales bacterium]|nr:SDR family oxidoreductase [Bacteroidales bacterium]